MLQSMHIAGWAMVVFLGLPMLAYVALSVRYIARTSNRQRAIGVLVVALSAVLSFGALLVKHPVVEAAEKSAYFAAAVLFVLTVAATLYDLRVSRFLAESIADEPVGDSTPVRPSPPPQ